MPSTPGATARKVLEMATLAGVTCRILPGLTEILADAVDISRIRRVEVEDLLRREPVELELPAESYVTGGTVLVTGAGGSIGSELVRQVARLDPRKVILYGHGENTLYDIQQELRRSLPSLDFRVVIGDIRDRVKIAETMGRYQPNVVFHAAAHKHVPLMEGDPDEAVLNNVAGTRNLAEAALVAGVTRFVNVSTDKAVQPASRCWASPSRSRSGWCGRWAPGRRPGQTFVSVRFGNVLGSRGSVVPIFQEQIRRGGPVLVTDPEMTRYFMTIPEASPPGDPGGRPRRERRRLRAGHGHAGEDRGPGPRHDPPRRRRRRRRRDRVHGPAPRREAPRGAVHATRSSWAPRSTRRSWWPTTSPPRTTGSTPPSTS